MASPFDDLDRKKLDETHKLVLVLVEQNARLQERLDKMIRFKSDHAWGRRYLRQMIRRLREKNLEQKGYIRQLEQQLRL
jgi:hypothetical protein